jgi:hypothetical protein
MVPNPKDEEDIFHVAVAMLKEGRLDHRILRPEQPEHQG